MPIKGGTSASKPIVSHSDNYEVLLIRVSHWLWKWYRAENMPIYLSNAIDQMAGIKYAFREPLRAERAAKTERIKKVRRVK